MKLIRKTNLGKCNVVTHDLTVLDNSNYQITKSDIIVHNSGKSFTANEVFGIDARLKSSFASSGLKVVNSDTAFEVGLKKNGINPKDLAKIEAENSELWDKITKTPGGIRDKSKKLTKKQREFYEAGRLGMIIDGTGHNYGKIKKAKLAAEKLGYDTYMVFVNTSLEVAKERNANRDRVLPDNLLNKNWSDVQNNLGKFHGLFGSSMTIIDNTVYKPVEKKVQSAIASFISKSIKNKIGTQWIDTARALKNSNLIKK